MKTKNNFVIAFIACSSLFLVPSKPSVASEINDEALQSSNFSITRYENAPNERNFNEEINTTDNSNFNSLPDDLIDKIFSFVKEGKTRTNLLLVSKHINKRARKIKISNHNGNNFNQAKVTPSLKKIALREQEIWLTHNSQEMRAFKSEENQPYDGLKKIEMGIQEVNKRISCNLEKKATLIIGNTGEGKTSLLVYLTQPSALYAQIVEEAEEMVINRNNTLIPELEEIRISFGPNSNTCFPFYYQGYIDCSGFRDSQGPVQDIINAYSIYMITRSFEKLKILATISEGTFNSTRYQEFLTLLSTLEETFNNLDELKKGLCLVITKNYRLTPKALEFKLNSIIKDLKDIDEAQKSIIQHLLSDGKNHISFFNTPTEEGPIGTNDRSQILEALEKVNFSCNLKPSKIFISATSQVLMDELAKKLNNDILWFLIHKFCPYIMTDYLDTLITRDSSSNVVLIREKVSNICNYFNKLTDESSKFENDLQIIFEASNNLKIKDLSEELSSKINLWKFIKSVAFKTKAIAIEGGNAEWGSFKLKFVSNIGKLTALPKLREENGILTLYGEVVGISDLFDHITPNTKEVNLFADRLVIDSNLFLPSTNLTMIAPYWYILGNKKISLKGWPGLSHFPVKAPNGDQDSLNGRDGLPGLPGRNGGNFLGVGNNFHNIPSLLVDVRGGYGGNGQDGGDGINGRAGDREKCINAVKNRKGKCKISEEEVFYEKWISLKNSKLKNILTFNKQFKEVYRSFSPGEKGGNGGKGGQGGFGGLSGTANILGLESEIGFQILEGIGERGHNGSGGIPGNGGLNIYAKGIFINEIFFPTKKMLGKSLLDISRSVIGGFFPKILFRDKISQIILSETTKISKKLMTFIGKEVLFKIGKESIKGTVKSVVNQGGKVLISVVSSKGISLMQGFGISFLVQGGLSPISAYFSSGWQEEPATEINENDIASRGETTQNLNENGIQAPSNKTAIIDIGEKITLYKQLQK